MEGSKKQNKRIIFCLEERMRRFLEILLRTLLIVWSIVFSTYLIHRFESLAASVTVTLLIIGLLVGFGLWVAVGWFRDEATRRNSLLAAFVALATLYLVEAGHYYKFRYLGFPDLSPPITFTNDLVKKAQESSVFLDPRNSYEVVRDLRASGINAFPAFIVADRKRWSGERIFQEVEMIWPLAGISNHTIVHCNESGYWAIYESDGFGFNNPSGLWKDSVDVLLLGDSFVHGACVPEGKDIGGRLRDDLPRTLNLGQRGNGPLLNLATLREYGRAVKPRQVVWFYTEGNDLINLRKERLNPFIKQYLSPDFSQDLMSRQHDIDRVIKWMTDVHWARLSKLTEVTWKDHIRFIVTLRSLRKRLGLEVTETKRDSRWKIRRAISKLNEVQGGEQNIPTSDQVGESSLATVINPQHREYFDEEAQFVEILEKASDEVESWGGSLHFVYLPSARRYVGSLTGPLVSREPLLEAISEALDIDIIDGHEIFKVAGDPMRFFPFRQGGHYNSQGYAEIAKEIRDVLTARNQN